MILVPCGDDDDAHRGGFPMVSLYENGGSPEQNIQDLTGLVLKAMVLGIPHFKETLIWLSHHNWG